MPRHLPLSGFEYPPSGLLPASLPKPCHVHHLVRVSRQSGITDTAELIGFSRLMTARRPPSIHGVFPSGSCSYRPAVPLSGPRLSCHSPAPPEGGAGVTSEVYPYPYCHRSNNRSRWACNTASKGNDQTRNRENTLRTSNLTLVGVRPSRAFSSIALISSSNGVSRWAKYSAPPALSTESAPYSSTLGRGFRGLACDESGWSLSRLPALLGFRTSSCRSPLRTLRGSGIWFRLG
jgi:hypothetical protein